MNEDKQGFSAIPKPEYTWVNPPDPETGKAQARFRFGKTDYNFLFYPWNAAAIFPNRSLARYVTARWLPKEIDVDKYDYQQDESFQRLAEFIVHFMQAVSEYASVVRPEILALIQLPTDIEPVLKRMWAMLLPDYLQIEPH